MSKRPVRGSTFMRATARSPVAVGSTCRMRMSRSKMTARFCASPKPYCAGERARDPVGRCPWRSCARRQPRHHHLAETAGVDRRSRRRGAAPRRCAATGTAPVWPRSGARNTGTSAAAPAFSTRSPMRTMSRADGDQLLEPRRGGRRPGAGAARRARPATARAMSDADHGRSSAHQVGRADSIWSAAVMTLPFIS